METAVNLEITQSEKTYTERARKWTIPINLRKSTKRLRDE
jgi:hypothetical protein